MSFYSGLGGGIGTAVGGYIGSKLGGNKQRSRQSAREGAVEDARYYYHTVTREAPKYGLHPLAAMGQTPWSPSSGTGYYGGNDLSHNFAQAGHAIGSAVGGRGERKRLRMRQLKKDALDLELHKAEVARVHSEVNKNNAIADSYVASVRNRMAQKANQVQDKGHVAPDYPKPEIRPLPEMGTPPEGMTYHDPSGWGDMHIPGGHTAAQLLEEMVGEPENPMNWPRMGAIILNHINRKVREHAEKHKFKKTPPRDWKREGFYFNR